MGDSIPIPASPSGLDVDGWLFHRTPWEPEFLSRFPRITQSVRIACPFIKIRNIRLILASLPPQPKQPITVKLLTRLNLLDCRARVHDLAAIELLRNNPLDDRCRIDVRVNNALHAKCFIFDANEVIITSSNLTFAAFHKNLEVALAVSRPEVIDKATRYFDEVFAAATPLSDELVESIRSRLLVLTPAEEPGVLDFMPSEPPLVAPSDVVSDDYLALDPAAVHKLDDALSEQLERDLDRGLVYFSPSEGASAAGQSEKQFFQDMAARFLAVFGGTPPSNEDLAMLFVHSSVRMGIKAAVVDADLCEHLESIGKYAIEIVIIQSIINANGGTIAAGALTTKKNYIAASDHCIRKFNDVGLARVLLHASMTFASEASNRSRALVLRKAMCRVVGFLALSRPWKVLSARLIELFDIAESFPFESYRDLNYKSELQMASQAMNLALPSYVIVDREGPEHDPCFIVDVLVGKKALGRGKGAPRKIAEMHAAFEALKKIRSAPQITHTQCREPVRAATLDQCAHFGIDMLRKITSREIPLRSALYALLPTGSPRSEYADKREELSILGAAVRTLTAHLHCLSERHAYDAAVVMVSSLNRKERIIDCVRQSPLWSWIQEVTKDHQFRTAGDPAVVIETVNTCFAVLFMEGGIDACNGFGSFLFRMTPSEAAKPVMPARSRLQILLQGKFRERVRESLVFELKPLHKPNESHDPLFQARIVFDGSELGRGTGKSRRTAEAAAAENALSSPILQQILDSVGDTVVGQSIETGDKTSIERGSAPSG